MQAGWTGHDEGVHPVARGGAGAHDMTCTCTPSRARARILAPMSAEGRRAGAHDKVTR